MRTTDTLTISLPPELAGEVDRLARQEGRTRSELFREAFRQYGEAAPLGAALRLRRGPCGGGLADGGSDRHGGQAAPPGSPGSAALSARRPRHQRPRVRSPLRRTAAPSSGVGTAG